jgi:hypothetical protein
MLTIGRSEVSVSDSVSKTITELEANDWGEPEHDSRLVTTIHKLRHKPIGEFTVKDLRITIGQSVGLRHLVPLAVNHLQSEPLAEGDFYPGDLLCNVISIDNAFWNTQPDLVTRLLPVVTTARDSTDDDKIRDKCNVFLTRWSP